ncbi:MAG: hypothetical protein LBO72_07355 [Helicobacteraceae bacterium]|jgi:hypothetical protein|nr:hypothetical protein [Helicobacteraceae bacterium]
MKKRITLEGSLYVSDRDFEAATDILRKAKDSGAEYLTGDQLQAVLLALNPTPIISFAVECPDGDNDTWRLFTQSVNKFWVEGVELALKKSANKDESADANEQKEGGENDRDS